jgi:hypothetical protein
MKQVFVHRDVDSACTRVGQVAQTAGTFLAGLCLFFGTTFAASIPASLENRIVYLFFVGLIPALVSYVSGYILRWMLGLSCKLCEIVAARCVRLLAPVANGPAKWTGAYVLDVLDRCSIATDRCLLTTGQCMQTLFRLRQKAHLSVYRWYWHVRKTIFQFSCLLIRNTARFLIRMQPVVGR